ncbi:MAG: hypothetical protein IT381_05395 [Deltaproteobacteria bacterium]|nr:hypothetical protein [Deltaproteobacteria bacterium]
MNDDRGQALTEYTVVMLALFVLLWGTAQVFERFQSGSFLALLRGFGIYSKSYDLILSLPFP